jgi:hypothetical protein
MPGIPDAEDRLRARLHEVDDLEPPDQGFELRALRAGRERQKRRQSWTRALVGAAAAVIVGAVAVPTLGRIGGSSDVTASSSSAAGAAAAPAPEAGVPGDRNSVATGGSTGPDASQPDVENVETMLVGLRSALSRSDPDTFTALVVDSATTPLTVTLHVTKGSPAAEQSVRSALPPGVLLVTEPSAFSAARCQATLARVVADVATLTRQGYALGGTSCDVDGRVAVEVTNLVTAEQIQALVVRYDDGVKVVQVAGVPTP